MIWTEQSRHLEALTSTMSYLTGFGNIMGILQHLNENIAMESINGARGNLFIVNKFFQTGSVAVLSLPLLI
jgi:hypothetical protein